MKKNIYNFGLLAAVGFSAILTGCSNDFDFDEARRENPEFVYKENFEKAFGTIDPNQSWDFTTGPEVRGTKAGDNIYAKKDNNYVQIGTDLLGWLKNNLKESTNNSSKGKPFVMTVPNNAFRIIPLYQGDAGNDFEIHLVVENAYPNRTGDAKDYDVVVWCRYEMENGTDNSPVNGTSKNDFKYTSSSVPDAGTNTTIANQNAASATAIGRTRLDNKTLQAVFSRPIVFAGTNGVSSPFPQDWVGKTMYFYLRRTNTSNDGLVDTEERNAKKTRSSLTSNFLYLSPDISTPSFIGTTNGTRNGYKIVGCEMNINTDWTHDWDLNDAVFAVEGFPIEPQDIEIKPGGFTSIHDNTKRYMVEDLGATDESDIDFNDIVIDITKTWKIDHSWTITNKVPGPETLSDPYDIHYSASVRALGGTKNLAVYIQSGDEPAPTTDRCIFVKQGKQNNTTYYNNTATSNGFEASYMYNTVYSSNPEQAKLKNHLIDYDTDITLATVNLGTDAGWDPEENNIYVVVSDKQSVGLGYDPDVTDRVIGFPEDGTVPFMIAVDKDTPWNWERANIFQTLDANTGHVLQLKDGSEWSLKDYPKK